MPPPAARAGPFSRARTLPLFAAVAIALVAPPADALPRFAARNGMECSQCHVNPTGGGMRNAYGRNVFQNVFLPWNAHKAPSSWLAPENLEAVEAAGEDGSGNGFSGDLTEWLAVGADLRAAYLFIRPDRLTPTPTGARRELTNTFFLMQADLYHSARLGDSVTLYLDVGVYTGFEAWGLFELLSPTEGAPLQLSVKAGRFLPPYGIREVEHQLATRAGIGFGQMDRDTGVELSLRHPRFTFDVALLNGTLGDATFDTTGTTRRSFEKAISSRASVRANALELRAELGGSFYFSENNDSANPLLEGSLPPGFADTVSLGVNNLRAGPFLTLSRGRLTYLGEFAMVRDHYRATFLDQLSGTASYQELSFVARQGLEFIATYEHVNPNVRLADDVSHRVGLAVELFPLPSTELRAMVRRSFGNLPTGPGWDAVVFLHLFL